MYHKRFREPKKPNVKMRKSESYRAKWEDEREKKTPVVHVLCNNVLYQAYLSATSVISLAVMAISNETVDPRLPVYRRSNGVLNTGGALGQIARGSDLGNADVRLSSLYFHNQDTSNLDKSHGRVA